MPRKPSIKQAKAIAIAAENGGNISRAMREAGYSPMTAKNPDKLTKSRAFQEVLDKFLPEDLLGQAHAALLGLKELKQTPFFYKLPDDQVRAIVESQGFTFISAKRFMTNAYVYFTVPDGNAMKSALDMAYKLRGSYAPEKSVNLNLTKTIPAVIQQLEEDAGT